MTIRALVWNENVHERVNPEVARLYPEGIHGAVASALTEDPGITAETATLEQPEHGLPEGRLDDVDVLLSRALSAKDPFFAVETYDGTDVATSVHMGSHA